jgi:hypothetical protein
MAHDCPSHFARLTRALLAQKGAHLFVHVDEKSDIAPFHAAVTDSRVRFLEDRIRVRWGHFSMVEATLALMSAAAGFRFDYLCLLSGVDYPVRSTEYIERFFDAHRGAEFINLVPMPNDRVEKPLSRLTQYRLPAGTFGRFTSRAQRVLDRVVQRDYVRALGAMDPHAGSQWWALTAETCAHVLEFVSAHPEYVRLFRHVAVPDESFFQTIIGNSRLAPRVTRNLTTVCWRRGALSPAVLDRDQVLRLAGTEPLVEESAYGRGEVLFARKFPDDSASLIGLLHR